MLSHPQDPTTCLEITRTSNRSTLQAAVLVNELFVHSQVNIPSMSFLCFSFENNQVLDTLQCQMLLRKEVIQPHLPVRLPCYDLVPITDPTFDGSFLTVRPPASGVTDFRDVTGGVYKARERIHRSVADLRLLATPTSWGRVADPNPN